MALALFVDGSVNPQTRVGYGAALSLLPSQCLQPPKEKAQCIHTQRFENTSSTQLELETLLWAMAPMQAGTEITVYTDCQNIMQLPVRRVRLEAKGFRNGKGLVLTHAQLYQRFYEQYDKLAITLVKVRGHIPAPQRSILDEWFSLVDRAARAACQQG